MTEVVSPAGRKATGHGPRRLSNGLAALGTTAVLAVYAAGFLRTQSAAEQLDQPMPRRRPMAPPGVQEVLPALDIEPPADTPLTTVAEARTPDVPPTTPAPLKTTSTAPAEPAASAPPAASPADPPPAPSKTTASSPSASPTPAPAPAVAPATATSNATPASKPVAATASTAAPPATTTTAETTTSAATPDVSSPAPSGTAAPATAAEPTPTGAEPTVPAAADAAAEPVLMPALEYKDGSYTGWGTSRHGDIEATVVIENGRIKSAAISKCWTRYPCSWIVKLPPQVVERQSPETDYISGATQSTNAFYYAVVEALGKAKP